LIVFESRGAGQDASREDLLALIELWSVNDLPAAMAPGGHTA